MFEKEAYEWTEKNISVGISMYNPSIEMYCGKAFKDGAEFGYNKANEWHYVKDGDLPRQDGHTCFSIEVLASNKKWVYYRFDFGKWFCGNKEVKVIAWKEIVLPELPKESE